MLSGNVGWVAALLSACCVTLRATGGPVYDTGNGTATHRNTSVEKMKETAAPRNEAKFNFEHVRHSQSLSAEERKFVLKRKQVVLKSLSSHGIECTLDSLPHIVLLGSSGGQTAAVGLLGSLHQMEKDGLRDSVLYLGGMSSSAWAMSSLYRGPQWSTRISGVISRLLGSGVGTWQRKNFPLTDMWGVLTSAGKQINLPHPFDDGTNEFSPYPIYATVNKNCRQHGSEAGKWFEMSAHEVGFPDLGFFMNTSDFARRSHKGADVMGRAGAEKQSVTNALPPWLKGLVGKAADENNKVDVATPWAKVTEHVRKLFSVLDHYKQSLRSLLNVTGMIRKNAEDPKVATGLDGMENSLTEYLNVNFSAIIGQKMQEQQKMIQNQLRPSVAPLQNWIQSLNETQVNNNSSSTKIFSQIWNWGVTENFLYQYPGVEVPACIRLREHLRLTDVGEKLNMPYPPFLGGRRRVDLIIALDYGASEPFQTLTLARDYAATMKKPFPKIDEQILREKVWPKDLYVFEGQDQEPTIVYMPLFNRRNCRDAKEFKARMEEFSIGQLLLSRERIDFLLETARANMRNNKEALLREIHKAVLCNK